MRFETIVPAPDAPNTTRTAWRRAGTLLGKLAFGVLLFAATVVGVLFVQYERERHSPLPNPGPAIAEACSLWFVGSSSMHKWVTLWDDMLPWRTHNRGVDGANLDYLVDRFASEQGVAPPTAIVFYAGENDLVHGQTVESTLDRARRMVAAKRRMYGALPMFMVSVKPSPTRWRFRPEQARLNTELARLTAGGHDLHFINIVPLMLVNGRPGPFYQADGIHLSHDGYRRWGKAVRDALATQLPHGVVSTCLSGDRAH